MADTGLDSNSELRVRQYDDRAFREVGDKLVLKPYMGTDSSAVIQVKENLMKSKGDQDTFALATLLSGEGVQGDATLEGNEEEQEFHDYSVTLDIHKNAIRSKGQLSERRSAFDLKEEAMASLTEWGAQKLENLLFRDLASINGVAYGTASEAQKDAWLAANSDRVLFGAAKSNNASNDHSAALLEIDNTTDKLTPDSVALMRRMAQEAYPRIKPIRLESGEEVYVLFAHNRCVRDVKQTDAWKQAQREARERSASNPIFTGAAGMYDGVVIVESTKPLLLAGVGASNIAVAANFLCGAQALCVEFGSFPMRPGSKMMMQEERFDYGTKWGVALMMMLGHGKSVFNSKQHGVVTGYFAAVAD